MIRFDRPMRVIAIALAFLAGYVDALGFLTTSGFFVSFMSGNSTRLAVGIAGARSDAMAAGILILCFVAGVVGGAIAGAGAGRRQSAIILLLVAALLAAAALMIRHPPLWTAGLLALAMGAENTIFEREGQAPLGLTYMTGSLVRIGLGLAGFITGRRHPGWGGYALLWLGLVIGAVTGASLFPMLRQDAMWLGSGVALLLAVLMEMVRRRQQNA
ncbi:YoaK family protein [Sphingobium sp. HBC34]|uniref:YoaK family protein n=1 Tax=Sphingobium cyanobacteriorum TaxID=3063954 RepID=A0ABT8ZNR4_9SPHN|nr:YoaK family protein [Sphingobium sp. HBC34]MDO7836174.1 YoaK family protein [Sphingobium sp. HBC34]